MTSKLKLLFKCCSKANNEKRIHKEDDGRFGCSAATKNEERCITWKIENMKFCSVNSGNYHQSPAFYTGMTQISKWALRIYPRGRDSLSKGNIGLFLCKLSSPTNIFIRFMLYEKNSSGRECKFSWEQVLSANENVTEELGTDEFAVLKKSQGASYTIGCYIKVLTFKETIFSEIPGVSTELGKFDMRESLDLFYARSLKWSDDYVTLKAREEQFIVKKDFLKHYSRVFEAMFSHKVTENQTNVVVIEDVEPEVLNYTLWYMYIGAISIMSVEKAIKVFQASDKYLLDDLKKHCEAVILEGLSVENVCDIAIVADMHSSVILKNATNYFFRNFTSEILKKKKWKFLARHRQQLASEILEHINSDYKWKCSAACKIYT